MGSGPPTLLLPRFVVAVGLGLQFRHFDLAEMNDETIRRGIFGFGRARIV